MGTQALLLAALTVVAYLPAIGRQEFVGTEDFRARIAHEMLASGRPLLPTYYGRPISTKPPLHYWALEGALAVTGTREPWSMRLSSLAALAATVAAVGLAVRAAAGIQAGWLAGAGYLLAANTIKNGVNAEIDPLFAAFTVGAVLCWWRALEGEEAHSRAGAWRWGLWAGLCAGMAVLAKGLALLPFAAGTAMATWRCHRLPPRSACIWAAAAFLPLALLWPVGWRLLDPTARADAITEGPDRFLAWDAEAWLRTLLYPLALVAASAPFSLAALLHLRAPGRAALDRYLCWTVAGAFALLALSAQKGTRYLLPCFPLLVAAGVLRLELLARRGFGVRAACAAFAAAAMAALPLAWGSLTPAGALALAALFLAAAAGWKIAPRAPVLAAALLVVPARAIHTQVYVPEWEARGRGAAAAVESLRAALAGARTLGVARLETPRLLEPLGPEVTYFDRLQDLARALDAGSRFDALLVPWKERDDPIPGHRCTASVQVQDLDLRIWRPEGD